jgi:hypothetical protein
MASTKTRRTVHDHPEFAQASEVLLGLESQRAGKAQELKSLANVSRDKMIKVQAESLLSGGTLTVVIPTAQIQAEIEILDEAISKQRVIVRDLQKSAAKEICESYRPEHSKAIREFMEHFEKALAAYDREAAIRGSAESDCCGSSGLPELRMQEGTFGRVRNDFVRYQAHAAQMVK